MPARFCAKCGASNAETNRYCLQCGQPLKQATVPLPAMAFPKADPPKSGTGPIPSPVVRPPEPPKSEGSQRNRATLPPVPAPIEPTSEGGGWLWIGVAAGIAVLAAACMWLYWTRVGHVDVHTSNPGVTKTPPKSASPQPAESDPPVSAANPDPPKPSPMPVTPPVEPERPPEPRHDVIPPRRKETKRADLDGVPPPAPPKPDPPVPVPQPVVPPTPVQPATPRFGYLHYAGRPISPNGEVIFDNLPSARLKFTFDSSSWQPLIQRLPNGTQRLILRSLLPSVQTQCDVKWEIVE